MKLLPLTQADQRPWASLLSLTTGQPYTALRQQLTKVRMDNAVTWGIWDGASLVALFSARPTPIYWQEEGKAPKVAISHAPTIHPRYNQAELYKAVTQPVVESLRRQGTQVLFQFERRWTLPWFHQSPAGYRYLGRLQPYWGWLSKAPQAQPLIVTPYCPDQLPSKLSNTQFKFMLDIDDVRARYCMAVDETYHFAVCQQNTAVTGLVVFKLTRSFGLPTAQLIAVYGQATDILVQRWLATMYQQGHRLISTVTSPKSEVRSLLRHHTRKMGANFNLEQFFIYAQPLQRYFAPDLLDLQHWNCIAGEMVFH